MTITYGDKSFLYLLLRWRGSVWKSIFRQYMIFMICYTVLQLIYRFVLDDKDAQWGKPMFERFVLMFGEWNKTIPITFLLGFYVSNVVNRWWQQLSQVSWPDKILVFTVGNINGDDQESRLIRRTLARYMNLLAVMVWKEISLKIKKRFPTDRHMVNAGLMTEEEFELFQDTTGTHGRWFLPVSWTVNLLAKCKQEGRLSDFAFQKMLDELYSYRSTAAMLTIYDWISIPLVYTQVITVATYGYFAFNVIARQSIRVKAAGIKEDNYIDIYFPLFTTLEFIFYIGWLKVGEELRCPFGEGDEDFNMNYVLDRNIHVSNMLVDELHRQRPSIVEDRFMNERYPLLPHTKASFPVRDEIPNWRLSKIKVLERDTEWYDEGMQLNKRSVAKNGDADETSIPMTSVEKT